MLTQREIDKREKNIVRVHPHSSRTELPAFPVEQAPPPLPIPDSAGRLHGECLCPAALLASQ